jgi:hypothetical protein
MTRKRRLVLFLGFFSLVIAVYCSIQMIRGYTISLFRLPHFSVPPNESSVEGGGLRMTLKAVEWQEEKLHLTYALEWVRHSERDCRYDLFPPYDHLEITYWDADGKYISSVGDRGAGQNSEPYIPCEVSAAFAQQKWWAHLQETQIVVSAPKQAKYVTMALRNRCVMWITNKLAIPTPSVQ